MSLSFKPLWEKVKLQTLRLLKLDIHGTSDLDYIYWGCISEIILVQCIYHFFRWAAFFFINCRRLSADIIVLLVDELEEATVVDFE